MHVVLSVTFWVDDNPIFTLFSPVLFWTQTQNSIAKREAIHSKVRGPPNCTKDPPLPQKIITSRWLIISPNFSAVSRHGVESTPCLPLFSLVSMLLMQRKRADTHE